MSRKRTGNNPPKNQSEVLAFSQKVFQGPLPDPQTLEKYNSIIPGAAERILAMVEKDIAFQHEITHKAIDTEARERRLGQIFGFSIGLAALSLSGIALFLGHPVAASTIGSTTVVGLVTVFVTGKKIGSDNNKSI